MKLLIEVFAVPGCTQCTRKRAALRAVIEELGVGDFDWRDLNWLEHTERAVALGVLSPPSLAIEGELVFPALPAPARLRSELAHRLERFDGRSPEPSSLREVDWMFQT